MIEDQPEPERNQLVAALISGCLRGAHAEDKLAEVLVSALGWQGTVIIGSENGRFMLRSTIREDAPPLAHETLDEAATFLEDLCTRKTGAPMTAVGGS